MVLIWLCLACAYTCAFVDARVPHFAALKRYCSIENGFNTCNANLVIHFIGGLSGRR